MLYAKNVPNFERIIRLILGIAIIVFALADGVNPIIGFVLVISALLLIGTGFIGWCPMCAMVGRKIKSSQPR